MVGSLKGSVGTGHDGVLIRGARKTHDGQLQLRIRETRVEGSQSFLSKILEMNLATKVRSEAKTIAVVIRDLDETATVDETATADTCASVRKSAFQKLYFNHLGGHLLKKLKRMARKIN